MANEFDPDLPSNTMVFEVRRDNAVWPHFRERLEELMEKYGLGDAERQAFRDIDVKRLGELGMHPYFLPQVTRLFLGGAGNTSKSDAAQAYRRSFGSAIID
jgi:Aromatic-ring-opening dioxygenase LigAB, LigA subunit